MLATSKDVLNIILAVSIFSISVFFSIFLFYMISIVKDLYKIMKETREGITTVSSILKTIRTKTEHSASYVAFISEGIKKVVEMSMSSKKKGKKK